MGVFVICWLPFFIWMPLTSILELDTPPLLYNTILWVGYCNSTINPFIYGLFCKEFRTVAVMVCVKMSGCCHHSTLGFASLGRVFEAAADPIGITISDTNT